MNTNNTSKLISVVQDILKQHDYSFDITGPTTFNLDGWPLNMCPVLEFMEDGMSLACPIAYYVTDEQRDLILDGDRTSEKSMKAATANQLSCLRVSSLMITVKNF